MAKHVLDKLSATIAERRSADAAESYTAKLFAKGTPHIAKKVGEEGVELALAGAAESKEAVIAESADLLYHLLALWAAREVDPDEVWKALKDRVGTSGIDEKRSRKD